MMKGKYNKRKTLYTINDIQKQTTDTELQTRNILQAHMWHC